MRLTRIDLSNFRLLKSTSVRFCTAPAATILVGPNNSGKTSVAEALQLFKGAEFDNVIVVLDDAGARWHLYSFDKFLSGADATANAERYDRTRNLFYVCCSRAKRGLAVVDLSPRSEAKDKTVVSMFGEAYYL